MNDYIREIALCDQRLRELSQDSYFAEALRERRQKKLKKLCKVAMNSAEMDEFQLRRLLPQELWRYPNQETKNRVPYELQTGGTRSGNKTSRLSPERFVSLYWQSMDCQS